MTPNRPPLRLTVPVEAGELRLSRDGLACELQAWSVYSGGHMMQGGVRLAIQDVRVLIHGLRYLLHDLEREEWRRTLTETDAAA